MGWRDPIRGHAGGIAVKAKKLQDIERAAGFISGLTDEQLAHSLERHVLWRSYIKDNSAEEIILLEVIGRLCRRGGGEE